MNDSERDALLMELKTAVVGIEGTEEKGMAGDIKEIKENGKKQNGRVRKNTIAIASLTSLLIGMGILEWSQVINVF